MATTHTYDSLTTALQDWEEDQGVQFEAQLDTIIGLGEAKLLRDLEVELFNKKFPITISSGNQDITRRTEFIAVRTVSITTSAGKYKSLDLKTSEYLDEYWPDSLLTGEPEYYCEDDESNLRIVPTPDQTYVGTARGIVRPAQLSSGVQTTWLSQKCGDLLFYACLIAAEIFLVEDVISNTGRIAGLKIEYSDLLGPAKAELRMEINADYSPVTPAPDA